ncbi:hypothetical protein FOL47_009458 [Perkinsus chesapeaki]|uniref:Cyclic nucleotide-binding domain-containing protein n=1 Tax=Perkinsus chesapeaki TaxID=330153 RepID=A0A7J6MSC9_PERCH|nr:hypothetical protein FOL47_009458 [Perkinsus chesapeaki]
MSTFRSSSLYIDSQKSRRIEHGQPGSEKPWYIISPESVGRITWDLLGMILILYECIVIPYRLSFEQKPKGGWLVWETFIAVFFILDVSINFLTAYYDSGVMEHRLAMVSRHYLRHFFLLDFVASFPYDWIAPESDLEGVQLLRFFKFVRLLKVLRLLRVLKLKKLLAKVEDTISSSALSILLQLARLVLVVLFIAHWIACLWYVMAISAPPRQDTWLDNFGYRQSSLSEIYIAALYWSFATMTTVGYGEIHPVNSEEQLFGMLTMLLACGVFAFFIGNIGGLVRALDSESEMFRAKNKAVKRFLTERQVPAELQSKVNRYLRFLWANGRGMAAEKKTKEEGILSMMSKHLRGEVMLELIGEGIRSTPFLCNIPSAMLRRLCEKGLEVATHAPGDIIFEEGQLAYGMYFLVSGKVKLMYSGEPDRDEYIDHGGHFGELALFKEDVRDGSARCIKFSETISLKRSELINVLPMYPKTRRRYDRVCRSVMNNNKDALVSRRTIGILVSALEESDGSEGDETEVCGGPPTNKASSVEG